ncbi:MAG: betaine/proline/choline family ABC transporter ATP-binding protein [Actinomycetota bacterium]|nr:betaine/proline/choline family ABC transporter ATP-binding protein [Actinomycetota bacterium]
MSTTEAQEHSGQPRDDEAGEELIRLEELGKQYPDGTVAVEGLSMSIPRGDTVVLVGPSGCGKTTTLKMINRIIEPTSGRIFFEGEDVTQADPDDLRRRMGYVIQQIGLFPHMTIFDNVATVPRLLKWDEDRVRERANELIEVVGLDPSEYANRFPKELSGGQQQRVGVARALGGDPPVMLMDEPFGATDPITRVRLQDEFLDLQRRVQKTTVFVTHDIDEAIKMGTRIAILRQKSQIAQYGTPENILSAPADDFVADFIGGGKSLKRLNLATVRDAELTDWPTASVDDDRSTVLDRLRDSGHDTVLLLDNRNRPQRWVRRHELENGGGSLQDLGVPAEALVQPDTTLASALNEMLESRFGAAAVVNSDGVYEAAVDTSALVRAIGQMQEAAESSS